MLPGRVFAKLQRKPWQYVASILWLKKDGWSKNMLTAGLSVYPASPKADQKLPTTKHKHPKEELRMRVFAGPNGSGKSTVVESVRHYKVDDRLLDFGYYVNADEIAKQLRSKSILLSRYGIRTTDKEFKTIADHASSPIHTAPPILSRLAPVTDASTLFSSRQRSTPISAITSASL